MHLCPLIISVSISLVAYESIIALLGVGWGLVGQFAKCLHFYNNIHIHVLEDAHGLCQFVQWNQRQYSLATLLYLPFSLFLSLSELDEVIFLSRDFSLSPTFFTGNSFSSSVIASPYSSYYSSFFFVLL